MSFDIYQASIPVFARALTNLRAILSKGQSYADARKIDPQALLGARLFPDMLPLVKQIQIASDVCKGGAARLAGVDVPSYADTETSFSELLARLDKTIAFVNSIRQEQLQGAADRKISLTVQQKPVSFTGTEYLLGFVTPNLYFHVTTSYALLRHNGVELGKADYLGMR
ncbi:MAG: DUF1993 domain-containing protein [Steroidobacteraceae bacterium]